MKTETRKKLKFVVLADHTIGYDIVDYLFSKKDNSYEIEKVYTNKNTKSWWKSIYDLGKQQKAPINFFDTDEKLYQDLKHIEFDYLLSLSWKHIISKKVLSLPSLGSINLHYSLLPRHRGVYPVNWAILSGDTSTGISYHFMNEDIDSGRLIAQEKVSIEPYYTAKDLLEVLDACAFQLFKKIWKIKYSWQDLTVVSSTKSSYHSHKDFFLTNEIDLQTVSSTKKIIDLLRGKTFDSKSKQVYFRDKQSGKKIYLSLELEPELI